MNFKEATDALFSPLDQDDLARQLGASVQAIRQARAAEQSSSYREPPKHWREGVIRLAESRMMLLRKLITDLKDDL
jgi:hypothetical protein